jgi:hypothetical protein
MIRQPFILAKMYQTKPPQYFITMYVVARKATQH